MMTKLGRLLTAMVTPFDEEGGVDYEQAKRLSLALLDSGSDGLVVSGTTGERPTLTDEEQLKLFAAVKEAVGNRGTVMAGTGSNCTREGVVMTREAERVGVDAILLGGVQDTGCVGRHENGVGLATFERLLRRADKKRDFSQQSEAFVG